MKQPVAEAYRSHAAAGQTQFACGRPLRQTYERYGPCTKSGSSAHPDLLQRQGTPRNLA